MFKAKGWTLFGTAAFMGLGIVVAVKVIYEIAFMAGLLAVVYVSVSSVARLRARLAAGPVPVDVGTASGAWRGVAPGQAVRLGWRAADTLCFRRGEA